MRIDLLPRLINLCLGLISRNRVANSRLHGGVAARYWRSPALRARRHDTCGRRRFLSAQISTTQKICGKKPS